MLGKAEYIKFVLGSVCHERAKIFIVDKILNSISILNKLAATPGSTSEIAAINYLKSTNWYQDFVSEMDPDFRKLYRFGAFVSKMIEKDKFLAGKAGNKLKKMAEDKKNKPYSAGATSLGYTANEVGDYHLQQIFVETMAELIEKTFKVKK